MSFPFVNQKSILQACWRYSSGGSGPGGKNSRCFGPKELKWQSWFNRQWSRTGRLADVSLAKVSCQICQQSDLFFSFLVCSAGLLGTVSDRLLEKQTNYKTWGGSHFSTTTTTTRNHSLFSFISSFLSLNKRVTSQKLPGIYVTFSITLFFLSLNSWIYIENTHLSRSESLICSFVSNICTDLKSLSLQLAASVVGLL